MREISEEIQYKIILGDFNLPHIKWNSWTTNRVADDVYIKFTEEVRYCFFSQHINDVIRSQRDGFAVHWICYLPTKSQ